MLNPVLIHTTTQQPVEGMVLVSYNWRTTAARVVPDSQKHRAVFIPRDHLVTADVLAVPAALRSLVLDSLETIAAARLADFCTSANMMATTISADLFKLDSLLAWNSERAALQQRLTADEIKAWAATSATIAAAIVAHGAPTGAALAAQFAKLAGPNHGLTPEKAGNLLTRLWKDSDADSTTGLRILLKLQGIQNSSKDADALDSILG